MSTVYVVQEPLMRSPQTGDVIRKMDLTPAKEFGELVYLLDWSSLKNGLELDKLYWAIRNSMDLKEDDYLLLIGHPIAMSIAFRVATEKSSVVRMLDWDRYNNKYNVVVFDREAL